MEQERRESLGATVRTLREARGLSRHDLAASAGISVEMLAKIEQGRKAPSAKTLSGLAKGLEIETPDLAQRAHAWQAMSAAGTSAAVLRSATLTGALGAAVGGLLPPVGMGFAASGIAGAVNAEMRRRKLLEAALMNSIPDLTDEQLEDLASKAGIDTSAGE